ncbi:MAG: transporter [Bacteroidales bacterium]|nr:transporter [Bacteroidales bacterium]
MELLTTSYFSLFLIVILGYILGKISVKGISLDVSGILFIAIVFGYFGIELPNDIRQIGLVLFIFTIGFQAGPSFFENFKSDGKNLLIMAAVIVFSGAILAFGLAKAFGFDKILACGLYTGAITSTPGLAALSELADDRSVAVGYGIAYPFGVIGIVLLIKLLPRILGMKISDAEKKYQSVIDTKFPKITNRNFVVENPKIIGKTLEQLKFRETMGATVSRIFHNEQLVIPHADTPLCEGDIIKVVGTEKQLEKVKNFVGDYTNLGVSLSESFDVKYVVVTEKSVIQKKLHDLHIQHNYNVVITRIRRSGIDFSASADIKLHYGDKLRIVGAKTDIEKVTKLIGGNESKTYETDYITMAICITLGILVGTISIPITQNFNFSLGLTGGIMLISILLSRMQKVGPIIFSLTTPALNIFRHFGLMLFLASVGTDAGTHLVGIFKSDGLGIIVSGMLISLVPTIIAIIVAKCFLKIDILQMLGGIAGGRTSTPALAAATSMTNSNAPSIAYTTVYPISIVLIVVCVQILFAIL